MAHRKSVPPPVAEEHNGNKGNRLPADEATSRSRSSEETASEATKAESRGWIDAPTSQRAEEMVDRLAENVGSFFQRLGQQVVRLGARAREEAEDIWAEADSIRQRRQS